MLESGTLNMVSESQWLELEQRSDKHVSINGDGFTAHAVKAGEKEWQIDYETETGAGTYGTVSSKQDGIDFILEKAGVIEDSGVTPKQVIIT
jgi:hypothetical protein